MKTTTKKTEKKAALIFFDVEKAFNNVNWDFLNLVIKKLKLGKKIENAILVIYCKPKANIIINNDLSRNINIQKGIRQGCVLSPLLFIMVLEILLRAIQEDAEIARTTFFNTKVLTPKKGFQYKYRAFEDDILFFVKDPLETMPKLLRRINESRNLAGFFINKNKSKLIFKNMTVMQQKSLMEETHWVRSDRP